MLGFETCYSSTKSLKSASCTYSLHLLQRKNFFYSLQIHLGTSRRILQRTMQKSQSYFSTTRTKFANGQFLIAGPSESFKKWSSQTGLGKWVEQVITTINYIYTQRRVFTHFAANIEWEQFKLAQVRRAIGPCTGYKWGSDSFQ